MAAWLRPVAAGGAPRGRGSRRALAGGLAVGGGGVGRLGPIARAAAAVAEGAEVPVALHLDHVTDDRLLREAADHGFGSVMFDGSRLDYADNLAATRAAADWAHANGLWLEAELGEVGGKDGAHAPGVRTDPGEAAGFVTATGVDALA